MRENVKIDFAKIPPPDTFDREAVETYLQTLKEEKLYGVPLNELPDCLFDPDLTDLSILSQGVLLRKDVKLSEKMIPRSLADLETFCRRLIDRGQDRYLIERVTSGMPGSVFPELTEEEDVDHRRDNYPSHVERLWTLKDSDQVLFDLIVSGRLNEAIHRYANASSSVIPKFEFVDLIVTQSLLWCSNDVQMVAALARRLENERYPSLFLTKLTKLTTKSIYKVLKTGNSYVHNIFDLFDKTRSDPDNPNHRKSLVGWWLKALYDREAKKRSYTRKMILKMQADLSHTFSWARIYLLKMFEKIEEKFERLSSPSSLAYAPASAANEENRNPQLRKMFAAEFSGLTSSAGMAVALLRYALAERCLPEIIERTIDAAMAGKAMTLQKLPPLPSAKAKLRPYIQRTLTLHSDYRRVLLDREGPAHEDQRDCEDRQGHTVVDVAIRFVRDTELLQAPGPQQNLKDDRLATLAALDVVPNVRMQGF